MGTIKIQWDFPRHEACANLLGELTRPTAVGEATIEVRKATGPGVQPHTTDLARSVG